NVTGVQTCALPISTCTRSTTHHDPFSCDSGCSRQRHVWHIQPGSQSRIRSVWPTQRHPQPGHAWLTSYITALPSTDQIPSARSPPCTLALTLQPVGLVGQRLGELRVIIG